VSYGTTTPYLPIVDLLKQYFQIEEAEAPTRIRERLTEKVLGLDCALEPDVPALASLLDATLEDRRWQSLDPRQRHELTLDAIKRLLIRESHTQPVCLVFEDLHWVDTQTQAAIDRLIGSLPAGRILLLVTYRPEYESHWGSKTYFTHLRLDPLGPELIGELLTTHVGEHADLSPLKHLLIERTEGNPFFLEETVRALVENGALAGERGAYRLARTVSAVDVPASVHVVLTARIDRLLPMEKRLLQAASVIGKDVSFPLLQAVVGMSEQEIHGGLARLRAGDFLYEVRLLPELEYTFKHALTRDVAYQSLLLEDRRTLHRRVGEAIEKVYADHLGEFSEALAIHFEQGEKLAQAASCYLKAAEKAQVQYAFGAATRFCERALEMMKEADVRVDEKVPALVVLGDLYSLMDNLERANSSYEEASAVSADPSSRRSIANKRHRPQTVVRRGARIVFYEHGGGDVTLAFATALTYGLAPFQPVLDQLCQEFRIITIDMRGTGASDRLSRPYSLAEHVEDVRTVLEALGAGPFIGIGVSRGANLLVKLSVAYPQLLCKLMLVGPSLSWDRPNANKAREILQQAGMESALRFWFSLVFNEPGSGPLVDQLVKIRAQLPEDTIRSFFDPDPEHEIRPLLARVPVPTLVIRGTIDQACSFEDARTVAQEISGAQSYEFTGKGHAPLFTATSEFCEVVRQFVRKGLIESPR